MSDSWLIYGANGYTGRLLAEEAVRRGHKPVLAGRTLTKVKSVADALGLEARAADLADAPAVRELVRGHALVLHAAGPFRETSAPMVEACIAEKASYLDITGEISVFASVFARSDAAKAAGIALIPGVGFDVVPTDCLARYVADRAPGATQLEIGISVKGSTSGGTAKSMLGSASDGGFVRRDGKLTPLPFGRGGRTIRFADKTRTCIPIPWGDVETAFHTTGILNITVYAAVPPRFAKLIGMTWPALWVGAPVSSALLGIPAVRSQLERMIEKRLPGPDATARAAGASRIWARALGGSVAAEAWLNTVEGYTFTALAGVRAAERVLKERPIGALTPSRAFGADFALEIPGTTRTETPGAEA